MDNISPHFSRSEFACKCGCGFDAVDLELVEVLEGARLHFGRQIVINSACRCEKHNAKVGGTKNSQHLMGIAADIKVRGVNPDVVQDYFEKKHPNQYGIGRYDTFTHIDVRDTKARWDYRKL